MTFSLQSLAASDCWHQVLSVGRVSGDQVVVPDQAAMQLPERCRGVASAAMGGYLAAPLPAVPPIDVESVLNTHCRSCDWLGATDDGTPVCEHVGCPICQRRLPGGLRSALQSGQFRCPKDSF